MSSTVESALELSLVLPVHDEVQVVDRVLEEWSGELERLGIGCELLVYDDGSSDGSGAAIAAWTKRTPLLRHMTQSNRGHGPTLLRGYREARGEWVFQTDSDGELGASGFGELWRRRDDFDLLLGVRDHPHLRGPRRLVSKLARLAVRVAFGATLRDVNVPYRLIRRPLLTELLAWVPADTFAPNVALSGLALRRGLRIFETSVAVHRQPSRSGALAGLRLVGSALRCAAQTFAIGWRSRRLTEEGRPNETWP